MVHECMANSAGIRELELRAYDSVLFTEAFRQAPMRRQLAGENTVS
jgi:hypothetical protein